ncbi:hypothetical protein OG799_33215 [Micromonospora sp. NBC_00898]|uniref:hypothetical protein n=1 Tax=Micromonospora sp. NBC_00898 TaxID=2975981 RepID=UPI003868838F|nr:hypothetical protein OG799_33215 [Micromonospora sp. NBC_00898]
MTRDGLPYAVFFAACYNHAGVAESWIDVVFGTWGQDTDYADHLTFGCRFGPGAGSDLPGATAVDAAAVAPDGALCGHKLTRTEALAHPKLSGFWEVIDFVVTADPLLHQRTTTGVGRLRASNAANGRWPTDGSDRVLRIERL